MLSNYQSQFWPVKKNPELTHKLLLNSWKKRIQKRKMILPSQIVFPATLVCFLFHRILHFSVQLRPIWPVFYAPIFHPSEYTKIAKKKK